MASSRHSLLKARLALVRRDLNPIVERLTPELLSWAPTAGMRTVAGQIVEIVGTEMQLIALLKDGQQISDQEAREFIGDCEN